MGDDEYHKLVSMGSCGGGGGKVMEKPASQEVVMQQQALKCPRCDSSNTKFCYYNNYSLSQPRHFCKACKRYWTRGGTLRNVPIGGGCRKNKRLKRINNNSSSPSSSSSCNSFDSPTASQPLPIDIASTSNSNSNWVINPLFYGNSCHVNLPLFNSSYHQLNIPLGPLAFENSYKNNNGFPSYYTPLPSYNSSIFASNSSSTCTISTTTTTTTTTASANNPVMASLLSNNTSLLQGLLATPQDQHQVEMMTRNNTSTSDDEAFKEAKVEGLNISSNKWIINDIIGANNCQNLIMDHLGFSDPLLYNWSGSS